MDDQRGTFGRREFLRALLAAGITGGIAASPAARQVLAMGQAGTLAEGFHRVRGEVLVNGAAAQEGAIVFPGDVITTSSAGLGVFVVGKDAFLVRENSRIELAGGNAGREPGATKIITTLKVAAGKLLSVFGSGGKRIETPTAVAGTRGTGVYIEAEPDLTYLCLCYGTTDLQSASDPAMQETFSSQYHEARYILAPGAGKAFLKAPKINHADEELVMLEALVGRKPPFSAKGGGGSSLFY